jgi:signal transduction histidine kinase
MLSFVAPEKQIMAAATVEILYISSPTITKTVPHQSNRYTKHWSEIQESNLTNSKETMNFSSKKS